MIRLIRLIPLFLFLSASFAWAETRLALVIGNSAYAHAAHLPNAAADASDIGDALERIGFDVTRGINLDYRSMRLMLRDFSRSAAEADTVVIYFAGHGIEIENTNYLIPTNAELRSDQDIEFEAVRLDAVLGAVASSKGLKLVLVDACRNNPFLSQMQRTSATRSIGRGLARVDPGGVMVGYAARSGTLALDGDGRNSPYAQALLEHLEEPGLELGKMFRKVRDTVFDMTNGYQEPFTYGSLPGEDIFLVPVSATRGDLSAGPLPLQSRMIERFGFAEVSNDTVTWQEFIDDFAEQEDSPLLAVAKQRLLSSVQSGKTPSIKTEGYEPWLEIGDDQSQTGEVFLDLEDRKTVQKALNMLGFDTGGIDGDFGPSTRRAISGARYKVGVLAGDHLDRSFLERLPNVPAIEVLMSKDAKALQLSSFPRNIDERLIKAAEVLGSQPVTFGYFGGHLYVAVLPSRLNLGWEAGALLARKMDGHLATLTSKAENDFVFNLVQDDNRFFDTGINGNFYGPLFGLYQPEDSTEPRGGWLWTTGERLEFTNWLPGQPDDSGQKSMRGSFALRSTNGQKNLSDAGKWNDTSGFYNSSTYIIEIE